MTTHIDVNESLSKSMMTLWITLQERLKNEMKRSTVDGSISRHHRPLIKRRKSTAIAIAIAIVNQALHLLKNSEPKD